jgi:hypothetical protein
MKVFLLTVHGAIGAFIAIQSFAADVATPTGEGCNS